VKKTTDLCVSGIRYRKITKDGREDSVGVPEKRSPKKGRSKPLSQTIEIKGKVSTGKPIPVEIHSVKGVKLGTHPLELNIDYFVETGAIAIGFDLRKGDVLEVMGN